MPETKSKIKLLREFLASCPHLEMLSKEIHVDWTSDKPTNYGIMPTGESIVERMPTVTGDIIYTKQYNFVIFMKRVTINDYERISNCDFYDKFVEWLEEQDINETAPRFGDEEFSGDEYITAQNGILYELDKSGDAGLYQIQVQVFYKIRKTMN